MFVKGENAVKLGSEAKMLSHFYLNISYSNEKLGQILSHYDAKPIQISCKI